MGPPASWNTDLLMVTALAAADSGATLPATSAFLAPGEPALGPAGPGDVGHEPRIDVGGGAERRLDPLAGGLSPVSARRQRIPPPGCWPTPNPAPSTEWAGARRRMSSETRGSSASPAPRACSASPCLPSRARSPWASARRRRRPRPCGSSCVGRRLGRRLRRRRSRPLRRTWRPRRQPPRSRRHPHIAFFCRGDSLAGAVDGSSHRGLRESRLAQHPCHGWLKDRWRASSSATSCQGQPVALPTTHARTRSRPRWGTRRCPGAGSRASASGLRLPHPRAPRPAACPAARRSAGPGGCRWW